MSEWISPAACQAVSPWRRCQDWAGLASPAVKKAIRCSSEKASAHDALEPRLAHAELRAHRPGILVLELCELGLDARGDRHRARALRLRMGGDLRRDLV